MAEDEDPVEFEIDVFLRKDLAETLCLLQFPLRPANKPYFGEDEAVAARIKAKQKLLEMRGRIDAQGHNYNHPMGIHFAEQANRPVEGDSNRMFPSALMDSFSLSSSSPPLATHYVVGMISKGQLHISPINANLVMRPSLEHLDEADRRKNMEEKKEKIKEETEEDEEETVTVTFKRKETERATAARLKSHTHVQKQLDEEGWKELRFLPASSPLAQTLRASLRLPPSPPSSLSLPLPTPVSPPAYLASFSPVQHGQEPLPKDYGTGGAKELASLSLMDHRLLSGLPLLERMRVVLKRAQLISFPHLLSQAMIAEGEAPSLPRTLPSLALPLGGGWVVRSEVLYPPSSTSYYSPTPASLLCRARNVMLLLLHHNHPIRRIDVLRHCRIPPEELDRILKPIAQRQGGEGWVLREVEGTGWHGAEPRGEDGWRALEAEFGEVVHSIITNPLPIPLPGASPTHAPPSLLPSHTPYHPPSSSSSSLSPPPLPSSSRPPSSLPTPSSSSSTLPFTLPPITTTTTTTSLPPSSSSSSLPPPPPSSSSLSSTTSTAAVAMETSTGELSEALIAKMAAQVNEYLRTKYVLSRQALEDLLKKNGAVSVAESSVAAILEQAGARTLPSPERSVFVLRSVGNADFDSYRNIILSLFELSPSVKRNDVLKACETKGMAHIPQNLFTRFMRELATSKGAVWTLKSGEGEE